ncbi:hypothetical protein GTN31_02135 [Macrococcoides canis]|uniref:hypothetical protein n=1 Tax=Macrococcoides canis TaxID=1855823 RepID=UPI0013E91E1A|nr:hypothetical protein [Macrococcus canis]QIH75146.1 hypothetical protein GTN31_02135 [Macrococcus canis]
MNRLIMLILTSVLVLTACNDEQEKEHKESKPKIEVKVNPEEKESKKTTDKNNDNTKSKSTENATAEASDEQIATHDSNQNSVEQDTIDTAKYNDSRNCLISGGERAECAVLAETKEYSKAWNNLTNEGYNCKAGACYQLNPSTQTQDSAHPVTHERPETVQPSTQPTQELPTSENPTTEVPTTEIVTTEVPSTEQPQTVQPYQSEETTGE